MPQLPPVAAAAFLICLLTAIVGTVVFVQVRSHQRRMRLAEMVRVTAPIPRPVVSTVEPPPAATLASLRGRDYGAAAQGGRFQAFEERPPRPPAPGRPARRLAAHVERMSPAAAVAVAVAVTEPESALVPEAPPAEAVRDLVADSVPPSAGEVATPVGPESPPEMARDALPFARPATDVSQAQEAVQAEPASVAPVAPTAPVAPSGSAEGQVAEPAEAALVVPLAGPPPAPEPQITVLPARPAGLALPGLMTREVALGDAARALRGALPDVLTMTDGRRLRRAVALGAATSVVAAAFAIRGRRR